jgi:O-antigen/teichoic acid export membrane protein
MMPEITKSSKLILSIVSAVIERTQIRRQRDTWMRLIVKFARGKAAHNGILTLVDQTVVSGTNFITGVILGRMCTKDEFGLYMLGFSIVYIFLIDVHHSIITSPYTVYSPRLNSDEKALYTGSTLIHELSLCLLTVLFLIFFGIVLSYIGNGGGLARVVWILATVITFIMFKEYARRISFAQMHIRMVLVLDTGVAFSQIVGLWLIARYASLSVEQAYRIIGVVCGIASLGWFISIRDHFVYSIKHAILHFLRNWEFGKWMLATHLANVASIQLYPWLVAIFHGTAATGVLGACQNITYFANPLLLGFSNFLGPETAHSFAEGGSRRLGQTVRKSTIVLAGGMGLFCSVVAVFGGQLVAIIYGDKYAGNAQLVAVLAIGYLVSSLSMPLTYGLLSLERPDVPFKSYVLATVVSVILGIPLIRFYGVSGAGVAIGLSTVSAALFRVRYFLILAKGSGKTNPELGKIKAP